MENKEKIKFFKWKININKTLKKISFSMIMIIFLIIIIINLPFFVYNHYKNKEVHCIVNNDYIEAIKVMKNSYSLFKNLFGDNNKYTILLVGDLGEAYLKYGDYNNAQLFLEKAYDLSLNSSLLNDSSSILLLNNLADLYFQYGDFQKSEYYFRQSLFINNKIHGKNSYESIASLLNIAQICIYQNHLKDAKKILQELKKLPNDKINFKSQFYYGIIHVNGKYHQYSKDYKIAEKIWQDALINKNIPIKYSSIYRVKILEDLGNLYQKQGSFKDAEKFYSELLSFRRQQLGGSDKFGEIPYADVSIKLANLYIKMGELDNAKILLNKAINIYSKYLTNDYPELVCSYYLLDSINKNEGNNESAKKYLNKANKLQKESSLKNVLFKSNLNKYCKFKMEVK